jgi:hypothetical protein
MTISAYLPDAPLSVTFNPQTGRAPSWGWQKHYFKMRNGTSWKQ